MKVDEEKEWFVFEKTRCHRRAVKTFEVRLNTSTGEIFQELEGTFLTTPINSIYIDKPVYFGSTISATSCVSLEHAKKMVKSVYKEVWPTLKEILKNETT